MENSQACPCGSQKSYRDCCQPAHQGVPAGAPEQLMRSRYSAYALALVDYLIETSRFKGPLARERENIEESMRHTEWKSLRVIECGRVPADPWVEFVAFYETRGEMGQLHEKSWFEQEEGCWIYVSGEILPNIRMGRNDPCWCGSGKKLKKCHIE